jgi:hypothetical protein|tara:strand:+ start:5501 stop:6007 length:507 start_codon:yes stop_codon:yes gene_type:complete
MAEEDVEKSEQDQESNARIGAIGFMLAMVAMGGWLIIAGVTESGKALDSPNWPSTQGVVDRTSTHTGRDLFTYSPRVDYTYVVSGLEYKGNSVSLYKWELFFSETSAQQRADEYPVGSTVDVFYDPIDPAWAVLEPGYSWLAIMGMPVVGLLVAAFGIRIVVGVFFED